MANRHSATLVGDFGSTKHRPPNIPPKVCPSKFRLHVVQKSDEGIHIKDSLFQALNVMKNVDKLIEYRIHVFARNVGRAFSEPRERRVLDEWLGQV